MFPISQPHPPCTTIPQQCATSHGPPEQSKYQMFVAYLQCPSCYPQPISHCSYWSGEEGGGGGGASAATDEWRHRDEPWACWWVVILMYCRSGNICCKNIFVVCINHKNNKTRSSLQRIITTVSFCTHGFTAQLASYFVQVSLFFDTCRWLMANASVVLVN